MLILYHDNINTKLWFIFLYIIINIIIIIYIQIYNSAWSLILYIKFLMESDNSFHLKSDYSDVKNFMIQTHSITIWFTLYMFVTFL